MGKVYFHIHDANALKDHRYWPWPMDKDDRYLGFYEVCVSKQGVSNPESLLGQKIYTLVGVTQDAEVIQECFPEKKWVACREYFLWQHIVVEEFAENDSQYFFRGSLFHAQKVLRLNDLECFQEMVKDFPVDESCLFEVDDCRSLGSVVDQMDFNPFSQLLDKEKADARYWNQDGCCSSLVESAMMGVLIDFEPKYIFDDLTLELEWDSEGWWWR